MSTNPPNMREELTFTRFDRICEQYPDNTAVIYLGERFSYARLLDLSERFAAGLTAMGLKKGDRILVYIANCPQWVITWLGAQMIGVVVVPVSYIYTSFEIRYMIEDSGAETIVCLDTNFGYVQEAMAGTSLKRIIVTNLVDMLPSWKRWLGVLFDRIPHGKIVGAKHVSSFKSMLKHEPRKQRADIDPLKDLSYLLYTGGTTGFPKGVPGNHLGMTSYVNDVSDDVAGKYLKEGEDVYVAINPLFHIMALGFFMSIGLNKGNTTILMPQPQVDAILECVQRYKARWFLGVPALYRMVLENDRLNRYDLQSISYCYCGGDVLPGEVYKRWKEHFGVPIYQVYGSTEVGHVCYSRIGADPKPGTIGRPLDSRQCLIVDPVSLDPVAPGESGELLVTSPYTVKQYWNKPDETEKMCVEIDGTVYCRMGDYVTQDEDGDFTYVERSADIIKHKGYRISASEVEAALQDHPTVIGACVVGVADARVGERIKAIVVLKEDARGVGGAELIQWCKERLASYKVPGYIEFRDMLPKSKVGKLLRREVRDEEHRRIAKRKGIQDEMDILTAIQDRRSCRRFLDEPLSDEHVQTILRAGAWAPSPLNAQPWQFVVVTDKLIREKIVNEVKRCRKWAIETSEWKWLEKYNIDFLETVPVFVIVVGDPKKTGVDMFMEDGYMGYQHACAAAVQNMLLAAHSLDLGSLWFTLFDKVELAKILSVTPGKKPLALVCFGKPDGDPVPAGRKSLDKIVTWMR